MEAVGRIGSFISRGVYTVSGPFHPFGGAVDIVVVQQQDGSFKSSPWYVRFGKFQGVLKTKNKEKVVSISVNGEDANFNMYLDRKGEAYFLREVDAEEEGSVNYTSTSSSDEHETDSGNQVNKRRFKSKSCNFDSEKPSSVAQIDVNNGKIVSRTNSRRSRILGLVFGRRSMKGNIDYQEEAGSACLRRIDSLERAQIAADLLELRWSTDLAGKPYRKIWDSSSQKRDNSNREQEVIHDKVVESETIVLDENLLQGEAITEVSTRIDFAEDTARDRNVEEVISDSTGKQLSAEEVSDASTVDIQSHEISEEISAGEFQSRVYCKTSNGSLVGINCSSEQAREVLYLENEGCREVNVNAKALHVTTVSSLEVTETEEVTGIHSQQTDCSCSGVSKYSFPDVENTPTSPKQDLVHSLGDKIESNCVAITSSYVSLGNQTLDENNATDEDVSASRPPSTSSEEEHFVFSDLDECRINDQCKGLISIEYEDKGDSLSNVDGVEKANQLVDADSNFLLSPENSITEDQMTDRERMRITSSPLLISGNKVVEEYVGQLTGSLPNMSSHINGLGQYPISCSLDSKPKSLMLTFVNDASNCLTEDGGNKNQLLHEESGAKDSSSLGDCRSTIVNPSVGDPATLGPSPSGNWRLWPFSSKRSRSGTAMLPASSDDQNSTCANASESRVSTDADKEKLKPKLVKKKVRANTPTSAQLESLHLEEGRNTVTFTFSTAMLGEQQVDAQIYLWKWNTHIVISDVDGTITRSDVLGQFMPLVGIDWSQTGVAHLFSAIKENGYQLLFLSARAISQAYHTRRFLFNLKQDGKVLPDGPVVISPDGLFPSLYREVIRRAPHEFKIPCLEDIKALFPSDRNPFYAGFGNRDTDEFSYLKVGIPKGKIFTINPKGEVAVNHRLDTKSYTSLHALVNGMFPPMNSSEQEDYNSWNFWKLPPPSIDI